MAMALAEAQAWPEALALASSPRPWHGPGPKLVARKESGSWHQTQGNVPKPQAMAKAPGHGHGSGPKLMGREGSGYRVWDVGYGVQGIGWWVLGIGNFNSVQHARRQMGRRILSSI